MKSLEFKLPDVGEGLSEAEIVEWFVGEGSRVGRDQVVVEVETEKSIVGIPASQDGMITRHGGQVGDVIEVGAVLFVLSPDGPAAGKPADAGETDIADDVADRQRLESPSLVTVQPASLGLDSPGAPKGRPLASPATRQLALQLGVDLSAVTPSGPASRITSDDVRTTASAASQPTGPDNSEQAPVPPMVTAPTRPGLEGHVVPLRGLRRQIAKTMTTAWQTVPHITDIREIDATNLVAARNRLREYLELDGRPFTFLPLFVKATVAALKKYPVFNATVDMETETITYHGRYNIGLATATDDGLIVPVLKDADTLMLSEISQQIETLTSRARARKSSPSELNEGTLTITNFGSFGGWIATPIIRPPESAIVGFGRIRDRVLADHGQPVVRPVLPLSVSGDHRLIDGDSMGGFLNLMTELLTDPILLIERA